MVKINQNYLIKYKQKNYKLMNIVLTNSKSKRKNIINWNNVDSSYELLDRECRTRVTKINFSKDSYIIVTEKLEEIHKILEDIKYGLTQKVVWDSEPSFDEVIEEGYNANQKNYRESVYNREEGYNANQKNYRESVYNRF